MPAFRRPRRYFPKEISDATASSHDRCVAALLHTKLGSPCVGALSVPDQNKRLKAVYSATLHFAVFRSKSGESGGMSPAFHVPNHLKLYLSLYVQERAYYSIMAPR